MDKWNVASENTFIASFKKTPIKKIISILPWSCWGDGENVSYRHPWQDAVGGGLHDGTREDRENDEVDNDIEEDEGRHEVGVDWDQDIWVPKPRSGI